jgi:hypothetical protein
MSYIVILMSFTAIVSSIGYEHSKAIFSRAGNAMVQFRCTANVKPLTKCLILQLYYNSFYNSFEIY